MKARSFSSIMLLFLFMILSVQANAGISLTEALKKGLVRATLQGSDRDSTRNFLSSYYGPCITLLVQSMSKSALSINLESGRLLETIDSTEQRMVVTRDELITLQPGKNKRIQVYAMCTQMHDRSPRKESLLALGTMAEGNLLEMTRFIGNKNYQSLAGQEAIWVITDNNDLGSIFSTNETELKELQQMASRLTGKPVPKAPHRIDYADGSVSGEIVFDNKQKESYSMFIEDEAGEVIIAFFEDKTIERPMHTTLTWKFRYKGFPKGVYYVKLITKNKNLVASRPIVVD